jgi:hypothetical protein
MRYFLHFSATITFILLGIMANTAMAWNIVTHTDTDNNSQMRVAYSKTNEGYTLEIYQDANGAVRSRFSMNNPLLRLASRHCPTFQVDKRELSNRSVNDARCIANQQWAEFILGYIIDNEIRSSQLHNMMNGNKITYRFLLENEGYGKVDFSLSGSKRILFSIIGNNVIVRTDSGFSVDE